LLAEMVRQPLAHDARDDIDRAAGGKADQPAHRAVGIVGGGGGERLGKAAKANQARNADAKVGSFVSVFSLLSLPACFHKSRACLQPPLRMMSHLRSATLEANMKLAHHCRGVCCWRAPRRKREARPFQRHDQLGNRDAGRRLPALWQCLAEVDERRRSALSIEPRNTKGSNENIPLLEAASSIIALVAGEPSYEAFMGIGRRRRS
jgi:hypothetical protein